MADEKETKPEVETEKVTPTPPEKKIVENNKVVPTEQIQPNNYNPKDDYLKEPELQIIYEKVKKSVLHHGQIDPILVRELEENKYEIVNGFHRFKAMQELGFKTIEIKNLGKITREDAIAKALSTEVIHIPLNQIGVAELVRDLAKIPDFNVDLLPYSGDEIQSKIDLLEFDWDKYGNEPEAKTEERLLTCPKCGHEFKLSEVVSSKKEKDE